MEEGRNVGTNEDHGTCDDGSKRRYLIDLGGAKKSDHVIVADGVALDEYGVSFWGGDFPSAIAAAESGHTVVFVPWHRVFSIVDRGVTT